MLVYDMLYHVYKSRYHGETRVPKRLSQSSPTRLGPRLTLYYSPITSV